MARKKKTVVAPKVVMQASPPRRILWVVLSSVGVMLAMWFSYDYGRSLHAGMEKPGSAALGVFFTPAVLVDGEVIESGHVPSIDRLKTLLSERG